MKKQTLAKIIQTKQKLNLVDISRIPDPNALLSGNTMQQDLFKENRSFFHLQSTTNDR